MSSIIHILKGTGVALVTPFKENGDVDFDALERVINYVIDNGVEYLVSLGTTGETPTLSKEEKKEIAQFTFVKANGRAPLVIGIGGNNTKETAHELETFPLENAVAVLSASPYYNKPSQEGLYQHYKVLASSSPKPIILYNVPGRTARNIDAVTTLRLANEVENIAGIKEASGDMLQCIKILKAAPKDFLVVSGDDNLALPQIACGMQGVISVAANSHPVLFSEMVRCALKNDFIKAKEINDTLLPAYDLMFAENNPAGVKAFLYEMGIIENNLRLPLVPLGDKLHKDLKKYLGKKN